MINSSQRRGLLGAVAALVALVVVLQYRIDPLRRQPGIEPMNRGALGPIGKSGVALPFEYTLGAVAGFRQVIAGLLWVRADSFFHQGNYDAILPLVRIISWLDPNFLDVYSTGAWHIMYNFTDEYQRSDRRYLPAGMALLNEGIKNNRRVYDLYADAGWSNFDKIKNFDEAVRYYQQGLQTRNVDYHRLGHQLAHALERAGRIDDSLRQWEKNLQAHQRIANDPKESQDRRSRAQTGIKTAIKNLNLMKIRRVRRQDDVRPPFDVQFSARVVRLRPKVLQVSGQWNMLGAKNFDDQIWGPVDGARVEVRLQDYGYQMPQPREFSFDLDPSVTIMQDQMSSRGGKSIRRGGLYLVSSGMSMSPPTEAERAGLYAFTKNEAIAGLGVPLRAALAGKAPLSVEGKRQLVEVALPAEARLIDRDDPQAVAQLFEQVRADAELLQKLESAGYHVATRDYYSLGKFGREIDMTKDPKMYSFAKDRYELILWFNPRTAPEFVQDRVGWSGEGMTDKRYLDTSKPGLRMIRRVIVLSRDDILGTGRKVLAQ